MVLAIKTRQGIKIETNKSKAPKIIRVLRGEIKLKMSCSENEVKHMLEFNDSFEMVSI